MSRIYLPWSASKARLREAENARKNRLEIVKGLSHGQLTRRDLLKMGLFTSAGLLAPIRGFSPYASAQVLTTIPTGAPPSPMFGVRPFTQPMGRFDVLPRNSMASLTPAPTKQANTTQQPVSALLGGGYGPIEGRPPGQMWEHQEFDRFYPGVAVEVTTRGAHANNVYNPSVDSDKNCGINPTDVCRPCFHPDLPDQKESAFWTFNGTVPPKLLMGRYGEGILFRHHNGLSPDVTNNGGFGRHTISTHEHNGHHGAENDGFTGAFFFPNQFYDYHYPIVLAGWSSMNADATDRMASRPDDSGGLIKVPGDWHETMSTHWFHDHMFSFTSQNVYSEPNPENKDGHMPTLLIGNEATGQWIRGSALDNPQFTATMIGNWMNSWNTAKAGKSYAEAVPLRLSGKGEYLFAIKCVTCHSIGGGDRIGPDLAGITATRDRGWLTRYIAGPDRMRDDPIAKALLAKFNDVRMPNLSLGEDEAADILAYVEAQTIARR